MSEHKERDMTVAQKAEFITQVKEIGGEGSRVLEFIASTESPDRANDIIDVAGWKLDNYLGSIGKGSNPIFAWSHDYSKLPVGKTIAATKDTRAKALTIRVKFPTIAELCSDPGHPSEEALFADTVYNMYKNGMLNAVSVGFKGLKFKTRDDAAVLEKPEWMRGMHFLEQELLEVSAVLVPCNQDALVTARGMKSFNSDGLALIEKMLVEKSVIPFKHYPLADEDLAWSASEVVGESEVEDLKVICTWFDEESPDLKGSYKLPHHLAKADKYKTVWKGCAAAMAALMGARGGVKIPEAEQEKCYQHLSKHYAEFDKNPPEWGKSYSAEELKTFFGEEIMESVKMAELEERVKALESGSTETKAGSKFSKATREELGKVAEAIKACHKGMKAVHETLSKMIEEPEVEEQSGTEGQDGGASDGREKPKPNAGDGKDGIVDTIKNLDIATASLEDAAKLFMGEK